MYLSACLIEAPNDRTSRKKFTMAFAELFFVFFIGASLLALLGVTQDWFRLSRPTMGGFVLLNVILLAGAVQRDDMLRIILLALSLSALIAFNQRDSSKVEWVF